MRVFNYGFLVKNAIFIYDESHILGVIMLSVFMQKMRAALYA